MVVCDPPDNSDGGSTLRIINDDGLAKQDALQLFLQEHSTALDISPSGLERFRSSLEAINKQIESDRLIIESMRKEGTIDRNRYIDLQEKYQSAIDNYRYGIDFYRDQVQQLQ